MSRSHPSLSKEGELAVSVILPVTDETFSLKQTVDIISASCGDSIKEFIVVIYKKTTDESKQVIQQLQNELGQRIILHTQKLPFLGGAIREAFELCSGTHVIMMASDLETDPNLVRTLIEEEKKKEAEAEKKEEAKAEEVIKVEAPEIEGPKVLDKIDLSGIDSSTRPKKGAKKKKEEAEQPAETVEEKKPAKKKTRKEAVEETPVAQVEPTPQEEEAPQQQQKQPNE